jgi:hypothetical protein
MKLRLPRRPLHRAILLPAALLTIAAGHGLLDPEFRAAAPPGWVVEGKEEAGYAWLRFSVSLELDGEDHREPAITVYRIPVRVKPSLAGTDLARLKLGRQKILRRAEVDREVAGVRWRGFEADYLSESGAARSEKYLFTGLGDDTLYIFWARGPRATWEEAAGLCEKTLVQVASRLASKRREKTGGRGSQ